MKPEALRNLSIFELVARYRKAVQTHGQALEDTKPRIANKQADIIMSLRDEFQRRGQEGRAAVLHLLADESKWVRLEAASFALKFSPQDAEPVLESLAKLPGDCGFLAGVGLDLWRKGTLVSDT